MGKEGVVVEAIKIIKRGKNSNDSFTLYRKNTING